jgi:lipoprotein-releasing system permease protein
MYKTFLSWRYMRRRKTNIIGIVGIGVGVGALIMILSIMSGFLDETKKTLRGGLSDLIIQPTQMPRADGKSVPYTPEPVLKIVRADPRVQSACAELAWFGILAQGGREAARANLVLSDAQSGGLAGVALFGIDAEDEFATTDLRKSLERESLVGTARVANVDRPFDPPPGWEPEGLPLASVIVGERLARSWGLSRGSEIEVITTVLNPHGGDPKPFNRRFVVAGTLRTGENETDLHCIYMDRRELADFLGPPRTFSQVLVKLKDYDRDAKTMREELRLELARAGLIRTDRDWGEVRTWEEFKQSLLGAIENERVLMAIMLSLVVIVAAFTIFAILSMMVT